MPSVSGSVLYAAVRTCLSRDRSRVLRTYAIIAVIVSLFTAALLLLALPGWIAQTDGTSATLMLAPAMLLLGGIAVIVGVMVPLLLVRSRLPEAGAAPSRERLYGSFGYVFVLAVYVGLIISAPAEYVEDTAALVQPLVDQLNALDPLVGVAPPLVVFGLLLVVDRRLAG